MPPLVWSMDIALPEHRGSSGFGKRKPCAHVILKNEAGDVLREFSVPVRVARVLENESLPFPMDIAWCNDSIDKLCEQVCMTVLTEMLSRRDHSSCEAREKLSLYGFSNGAIDAVVSRALSHRFLDDQRFASYFMESRKGRGWGRRKIELELKRKGIALESIYGYPDEFFDSEDDFARAQSLLQKKRIPESRPYEKLVRHLISKGFDYSIASRAVRDRLDCSSLEDNASSSTF